jgi:hypothetical protein
MNNTLPASIVEHEPPANNNNKRCWSVGLWELEWQPSRPFVIWAIAERHKSFVRASGGIYYGEDRTQKMGWDLPVPPAYVRNAALAVMRQIHQDGGK